MTTKTEVPAKVDFAAEMAEWIEAFDDVVAEDWKNGAELLKSLRQRGREAGVLSEELADRGEVSAVDGCHDCVGDCGRLRHCLSPI